MAPGLCGGTTHSTQLITAGEDGRRADAGCVAAAAGGRYDTILPSPFLIRHLAFKASTSLKGSGDAAVQRSCSAARREARAGPGACCLSISDAWQRTLPLTVTRIPRACNLGGFAVAAEEVLRRARICTSVCIIRSVSGSTFNRCGAREWRRELARQAQRGREIFQTSACSGQGAWWRECTFYSTGEACAIRGRATPRMTPTPARRPAAAR